MWGSLWRRGAIVVLSASAATAALLVSGSVASASSGAAHASAAALLGQSFRPYTPAGRPKPSHQPRFKGKQGAPSPWVTLTNAPPGGFIPGSMNLMTDGTVLIHDDNTGTWERLTPNASGSYQAGTWSSVASMPSGYQPLYYASQVLNNGELEIQGGEYNGSGTEVWTNLGAIYHPLSNTWTSVSGPSGWSQVGDAQSVMIPTHTSGTSWSGGRMLIGDLSGGNDAYFNPANLSWTNIAGTGKLDRNDEEGWTLLLNGKVLTVDIEHDWNGTSTPCGTSPNGPCTSELFNSVTNTWSATGNVPVDLPSYVGPNGPSEEMGPQVARPDGTVFAIGGNDATATYHPGTGTWTAGPTFPSNQDAADSSASILPNGDVLAAVSPGVFNSPTHFYVYNGSTLTQVADTANSPSDSSYTTRMMVLPTGQVLFDDGTGDIEIFNADLTSNASWAPTVSSISSSALTPGSTYSLSGTQLSGRDGGAAYGDDNQSSTNYPLVRLTNTSTNHVYYARTSGFTYATGSGATSSTSFTVKAGTPAGNYNLQVVANGIPSTAHAVTVS